MPATALSRNLRRIANETAELPGVRLLAKPVYREMFRRHRHGNAYFGVYESFDQARDQAPDTLPNTYDNEVSGGMYRDQLNRIRVSDYPLLHWVSRLLDSGERKLFDLGGHIGVSYYGFSNYLAYPADMTWRVHDMPRVLDAGRDWAKTHDPSRRLVFTDRREDADGHDILLSSGALQYLDYELPDLLRRLRRPPPHVLINLTPMHPSRGYFTLQNLGIAICPYRVSAVPQFVADMAALGYQVADRWESFERQLRVPFEPALSIDRYYGFYFHREGY